MPLETGTQIGQLDPANPPGTDPVSQADDHLRLIKECVQGSLGEMLEIWGIPTNDLPLKGLNAAGDAYIDMIQVDAADAVYLAPAGGPTEVGGDLKVSGTATIKDGDNSVFLEGRTDGGPVAGIGASNISVIDGVYSTNPVAGSRIAMAHAGSGGQRGGLTFASKNTDDDATQPTVQGVLTPAGNWGFGTTNPQSTVSVDGSLGVTGSLSKGSGSFRIDHPLKPETHELVHSFTESPQADLLYSGTSDLVDGAAEINLDEFHSMTEGTFAALNRNIRVFTTNESDWEPIRGSVSGNILTISCRDDACTDKVSWLVIGERQDEHMMDTDWTDEQGRVIVEPRKRVIENA